MIVTSKPKQPDTSKMTSIQRKDSLIARNSKEGSQYTTRTFGDKSSSECEECGGTMRIFTSIKDGEIEYSLCGVHYLERANKNDKS